MVDVSTEDLVLAHLVSNCEDDDSGDVSTLADIAEHLSLSRDRLSEQIELVSTLESLEDRGLVHMRTAKRDARTNDHVTFALTETGCDHARPIREQLATTTVEVAADRRVELSLSDAASRFARPLVEIAANCTDDGVYYPADAHIQEFIGRQDDLQACLGRLATVREGTGQAVFLVGPAGVGKTTLADKVLDDAAEQGFDVLRARCRGDGTTPYQPLRDALATLDGESPFADVGPAVDDVEAYRTQQTALFTAVTDTLVGDGSRPRILYLDDLHLADTATLTYIEHLLPRLADRQLGLVGSYRPQDLPGDAPMASRTSQDDRPVTHVTVQPFDREHTRALIERVVGRRGVPAALVDAVYDRTGGNPMYVEETIRALLDVGDLDPDLNWYPETAAELSVPAKVRKTIDHRVDGFPAAAQELLSSAAILGEKFPETALEWVSDLSVAQIHTYVDLFVNGAIIERTGDGHIQFRTGVVQEALLDRLSIEERRNQHAAAAKALAANDSDEDPTQPQQDGAIAHHHDMAGHPSEAIEWYRRAAERATDVYAHEVAIEHNERALTLAKRTEDENTSLAIIEALARIYVITGAYDDAHRHVEFARERTTDDNRLQRLTVLAARIATERGSYERAIELAGEGLALDEASTPARCELLGEKALAELEQGLYDRSRTTVENQLAVADELDDDRLEGNALVQLGRVARSQGSHGEARHHLQQAADLLATVGDRHGVADTHTNLGEIAREQSDYEDASDHFQRAQDMFGDIGDRHSVAKVLNHRGLLAWVQSEYDMAREFYREACETFRAVGDRHGVAKTLNNLGLIAREQSEYDEAREKYERALEINREIGAGQSTSETLSNLGQIDWELGNLQEAREYFQRSLDMSQTHGDSHGIAVTQNNIGTVALDEGSYGEAEDYLERALAGFREIGDRHAVGKVLNNHGLLARERNEYTAADEYYRRALDIFREVDAPHDIARARSNLGIVATVQGSYDEAHEHFQRALDGFRSVDDHHGEAECLVSFGKLALETGEISTAQERAERALSILQEIGVVHEALDALSVLVDCAHREGNVEEGLSWCHQARSLLTEATMSDVDNFDERRREFEQRQREFEDMPT